jgi:hypothetical protein
VAEVEDAFGMIGKGNGKWKERMLLRGEKGEKRKEGKR